ncbi:hypothetical protein [Parafrankia discariae]|uniref:hypothetical protein n=1 Tax=Parafrankia discariae TaxID=365528 RepID=UPI000381E626|nr:hypothetical protein [Parafrankia discariae]
MSEVRCPICLYVFEEWPDAYEGEFHEYNAEQEKYEPVDENLLRRFREEDQDPQRRRFQAWLATKYVKCPNPYKDQPHYLFYPYGWYGEPFMIGMVGATGVGKSHLLAAMIGQLVNQRGLDDLGLSVTVADPRRHQDYVTKQVDPLLVDSKVLAATQTPDQPVEFIDAVIVSNLRTGRDRLVTFYDISGESFVRNKRSADFVNAAGALVFVVDPHHSGLVGDRQKLEDEAFNAVLGQLKLVGRKNLNTGLYDVNAAVVVNKADVLRFQPPVQDWYRKERLREWVNLDDIHDESSFAYALLYSRDATAWLAPVRECQRATLHFASATGAEKALDGSGSFRRRVQPNRVLEVLVAVFAMGGIIDREAFVAQRTGSVGV